MVKLDIRQLQIWFGAHQVLKSLTMSIAEREILSVIGPANSGKTTFLRTLNRLNDLQPRFRMEGDVTLDGRDIRGLDPEHLRQQVGMVFAMPSPLPLSIFDNVAYGVRMHGRRGRRELADRVEDALRQAYLWDEVKDRLDTSAFKLSGGQQQRLCIARTLAVAPAVILFDEPCSGLDPISTARVEDTMLELKKRYTLVLVTNNVKQAARVGDRTAFFLMGELIELCDTHTMFTAPSDPRSDDYIRGKFG